MQNQKKKLKKRNYPTASRKTAKNSRSVQQKAPAKRNGFKVPEALPTKNYREPGLSKLKQVVFRKKPEIKEIVREPTAGGIVFRPSADNKDIEILLIQDSKDRWTIPKGHIEPGETAKQTAVREIGEESGLKEVDVLGWLGKIHFKYRRADKLVLMTTQVYLVQSLDKNERPTKEKWMNGIRWFSFNDALDAIEYADIEKLMLIAKRRVRNGEFDGQK
jgi:ADP-ribose pyrophosphatase YjhB (NUDIX family)